MSSSSSAAVSTDGSDGEGCDRVEKIQRILKKFRDGCLQVKTEPGRPGSFYCPFCPGKKPKTSGSMDGHAKAEASGCTKHAALYEWLKEGREVAQAHNASSAKVIPEHDVFKPEGRQVPEAPASRKRKAPLPAVVKEHVDVVWPPTVLLHNIPRCQNERGEWEADGGAVNEAVTGFADQAKAPPRALRDRSGVRGRGSKAVFAMQFHDQNAAQELHIHLKRGGHGRYDWNRKRAQLESEGNPSDDHLYGYLAWPEDMRQQDTGNSVPWKARTYEAAIVQPSKALRHEHTRQKERTAELYASNTNLHRQHATFTQTLEEAAVAVEEYQRDAASLSTQVQELRAERARQEEEQVRAVAFQLQQMQLSFEGQNQQERERLEAENQKLQQEIEKNMKRQVQNKLDWQVKMDSQARFTAELSRAHEHAMAQAGQDKQQVQAKLEAFNKMVNLGSNEGANECIICFEPFKFADEDPDPDKMGGAPLSA
ncbi:hypothetical protein WJX74_005679 [Apatococcus lobatus]|uniref:XS domain-containing protein n=1 Tax=Apatococcus lobatus TaxID=904363 RepID=A0AAW1QM32_9CHLO